MSDKKKVCKHKPLKALASIHLKTCCPEAVCSEPENHSSACREKAVRSLSLLCWGRSHQTYHIVPIYTVNVRGMFSRRHIELSALTLKPLTCGVNNIDYLATVAPVEGAGNIRQHVSCRFSELMCSKNGQA